MLTQAPIEGRSIHPAEGTRALSTRLQTELGDKLNIFYSLDTLIEITAPNVSKGNALSRLADHYGLAQAEVMAIGDQDNDIDMVEWAGLGVAIGNAAPDLIAVADHIAPSVNEEGVVWAIEQFILQPNQQTRLQHYQAALTKYRAMEQQAGIAVSLLNIGHIYHAQAELEQALLYYRQALDIFVALNNKTRSNTLLKNMEQIYRQRADHEPMLQRHFQQAIAIQQQLGDKAGMAILLNNIGRVYKNRGNLEQALEHYCQALSLNRELNVQGKVATGLNEMGLIYQNLGRLAEAVDHFQQALDINRAMKNKVEIAANLWNIGDIYLTQKRYTEAETVLAEADRLFETMGHANTVIARQWLDEAREGIRSKG